MTNLEKIICKKFGTKYGVFTGNGTTAMYLAFMALNLQDKKVIFPAISCTNPVNAAIYAGYEVDFCDISLEDFTMDLCQLEGMLKTGQYGIIVPTHIYGHRYDDKAVRQLCTAYDVILMEDAAQSFFVGDMDVSIMSFGHTKVCDTRAGGGIALTNDYDLMNKMVEERKHIPTFQKSYDQLLQQYRQKYYDIVKNTDIWEIRNERIKKLQLQNKDYFIFDLRVNDEVYNKLDILDELVENRRVKSKLYDELLDEKHFIRPDVQDNYRWRYSFLYKNNREDLLNKARQEGIDISSWYYSLAGIYKGQHLKNADIVERKIVNLWVDESHSIEKIRKDIKILNSIMGNDV